MIFKRYESQYSRPMLYLWDGEKIVAWVCTTINGKWTYSFSKYNHQSPPWIGKFEEQKLLEACIPYEKAYDTEQQAANALMKIIGN